MWILRTAVFILFYLPFFVNAQSHCVASETDYFSCKTSVKDKIVSICGKIGDEGITGTSWLQYRFGQLGKVELIYPKNKTNSIKKFEGNYFFRYDTVSIRFIDGHALFDLTVLTAHEVEGEKIAEGGGVTVTLNKNRNFNIPCQKANVGRYFSRLALLATELGESNGQTDFLYQFMNQPAK